MNRVPTGITGLDALIEGGIPEGRSLLVSGGTGTGKTIFGLQYLYFGAKKYNEPGIYVTLDERPDLIRQDMIRFGWDLRKLEDENMLHVLKKMGCDVIQGYMLSKPLAPEKFLEWLNQTNYQVGFYQPEQTRRMH